jgi:flagellar motor switch protein FliN
MTTDAALVPEWLTQLWANALETVIESMTAERPTVTLQPSQQEAWSVEGSAWWGQSLSLVPSPTLWVGAPAGSWEALGQLILKSLGVDEFTETDIAATCRDILAQVSSSLAQQLAKRIGEPVTGGDVVPADQPPCISPAFLTFKIDAGNSSIEGTVLVEPALLDRLHELTRESEDTSQPAAPSEEDAAEAQSPGPPPTLLPKVQLRVRFVLGRASLPLSEIFRISVGSVIELDRRCTDFADIMIDRHRIARGQVVVVSGNYGIKVVARK